MAVPAAAIVLTVSFAITAAYAVGAGGEGPWDGLGIRLICGGVPPRSSMTTP